MAQAHVAKAGFSERRPDKTRFFHTLKAMLFVYVPNQPFSCLRNAIGIKNLAAVNLLPSSEA